MINQTLLQCGTVTEHTAIKTQKNGFVRTALSVSRDKYAVKLNEVKVAKENDERVKSKRNLSETICKYCKELGHVVGHFDKTKGRFVTTCEKAVQTNKRKEESRARRQAFTRTNAKKWQNRMSSAANTDTGTTGWDTKGTTWSAKTAEPKPRVSFASVNRFDMGDFDDTEPNSPAGSPGIDKEGEGEWFHQQASTVVAAGKWGAKSLVPPASRRPRPRTRT